MDKRVYINKLHIWILLLTLSFVLSGCGYTKETKETAAEEHKPTAEAGLPISKSKGITIAMVSKSLSDPTYLDIKQESERVGNELGVKIDWMGPMHSDPDEQEAIVEGLIRSNVDGIVIDCIDSERMKPMIDKAVDLGIKVATFDSDSPNSKRLFYCGIDNYAAGEAAGNALVRILKAKNEDQRMLGIYIMTANEKSFSLNERLRGFFDATKRRGLRLFILDTLYSNGDMNTAEGLLENEMQKDRFGDIFFSTGSWPLLGPPESLPGFQRWRMNGGTSIVMDAFSPVGVDPKGLADASIGQDYRKMAELSVRNMVKAIQGEKISSEWIDTGFGPTEKTR